MTNCHACGDPIENGSVPLDTPDGDTIHVHGQCFLKDYGAKAFFEDQPKSWSYGAHASYTLEEHVSA